MSDNQQGIYTDSSDSEEVSSFWSTDKEDRLASNVWMMIMNGVAVDFTFKNCFFAKKSELDVI